MNALQASGLRFEKHHGAGNDFLVLVDPDGSGPFPPEMVRALCDRRFGVGADGVIRVTLGWNGADLGMVLQNADGGEAEMSGNGIRCLAQAAVLAELVMPPTFTVDTATGCRTITYFPGAVPDQADASVDLGTAVLGPDQPQSSPGRKVRTVDTGNPHLVMMGADPADVDVAALGAHLQEIHEGGINVEFVAPGATENTLIMRVFERGVGETMACGTGSVAAAVAAFSWGVVGTEVHVRNPGGTLEVTLTPEAPSAASADRSMTGAGSGAAERGLEPATRFAVNLRGPVRRVGTVVVDLRALLGAARP